MKQKNLLTPRAILALSVVVALLIPGLAPALQVTDDSKGAAGLNQKIVRGKVVADENVSMDSVKLKACYLQVRHQYPQPTVANHAAQVPPEVTINNDGEFEFHRLNQPMLLRCETDDRQFAGAVQIGVKDDEVNIRLGPVSSLRGRLVDHETGEPLAGQRVIASIHYFDPDHVVRQTGLLGTAASTDKDGCFEFSGLVANQQYDLMFIRNSERHGMALYGLGTFKTNTQKIQDLGDVDTLRTWFSSDARPLSRFTEALTEAKRTKQGVLAIFCSPTDPAFREIMRLRTNNESLRQTLDNYRLIAFDSSVPPHSGLSKLTQRLDIELQQESPSTHFCIFNTNGELLDEMNIAMTAGQKFPQDRLREMLLANIPSFPDAAELFETSLKRAATNNKKILLQESGPNCGPCVNMHKFLTATRELWSSDFVWLELDQRWPGTEEIIRNLRGDRESTIPWYAILDADGKMLASSFNSTDKNMGFPASRDSNSHFRHMIEEHATRMTADDISRMMDELKK